MIHAVEKIHNFFQESIHSINRDVSIPSKPYCSRIACSMASILRYPVFSFEDKNFLVSIVVAGKSQEFEYNAVSYQITQCGKGTTVTCPVKYVSPDPQFDVEGFMSAAEANVDKGKWVYKPYQPSAGYNTEPVVPHYMIDNKGNVMTQKEIDEATSFWD